MAKTSRSVELEPIDRLEGVDLAFFALHGLQAGEEIVRER